MYRSKAKATPEEIKMIQNHASAPMIMLHIEPRRKTTLELCHELAIAHGLKEQQGFYGLDTSTGEFLSEYPIEESPPTDLTSGHDAAKDLGRFENDDHIDDGWGSRDQRKA